VPITIVLCVIEGRTSGSSHARGSRSGRGQRRARPSEMTSGSTAERAGDAKAAVLAAPESRDRSGGACSCYLVPTVLRGQGAFHQLVHVTLVSLDAVEAPRDVLVQAFRERVGMLKTIPIRLPESADRNRFSRCGESSPSKTNPPIRSWGSSLHPVEQRRSCYCRSRRDRSRGRDPVPRDLPIETSRKTREDEP